MRQLVVAVAGVVLAACSRGGARTFSIGGTLSGLAGRGLVLPTTSEPDLAMARRQTAFMVANEVAKGASHVGTAADQPSVPSQSHLVASGTGVAGDADVPSDAGTCRDSTWVTDGGSAFVEAKNCRTGDNPHSMPDAGRRTHEVGQDTWFSIQLHGPLPVSGSTMPFGFRAQVFPYKSRHLYVALEGIFDLRIVGPNKSLFSMGCAGGGGARVQIPLVTDGTNDALLVSPGVDFVVAVEGYHGGGGWVSLSWGSSPYSNIYFLGTNVDVFWLHMYARHFGIELGVSGGASVSFGGLDNGAAETRGHIYPEFAFFVGMRF